MSSSSVSPEAVVRSYLALLGDWEAMDPEVVVRRLSEDAEFVDGPRGTHRGRDAIKAELEAQKAIGFSDLVMDVKLLLADTGTVMMEREDSFTLSGKRFSFGVMAVAEVNSTGEITHWREYYDLKSITDQMEAAGL